MKNLILYTIFLIAQSSIAQGTKHLWSSNDGSISIKVNFSGVDPGGGEIFYFIVENNTSNDMNVSFNYTFVLSEVSADCPHKTGSYNKVIGAKKTNNDGGYSGSISKAKMCSGGRGTAVLSWGVTNVRTENMSLPKINQLLASANAKIKSRDFVAAQKYIDEASNLCNYCELQQSISTVQENLREEKLAFEQEKFEKEQEKIRAKEEEERKELERKEAEKKELEKEIEKQKESTAIESNEEEKIKSEESNSEKIETNKKIKEEEEENKNKEESKKIDYRANEKYSLQLAINTILSTEQNNTYNFSKDQIVISGFKYYDYIDMVINWCDSFQAKWGYDAQIENYKSQISQYSRSMVIAKGVNEVFEGSSKIEIVGSLGLQPTSLINENPNTLYETYNLELRFHFIPGWFKLIAGVGIGTMDFPDLTFSASKNGQPAFDEVRMLSVDHSLKNFRLLAGFHQRIALNEDKTIHLSFEQIGKLNFLSTGDKFAYSNSTNGIEIPLETSTDQGYLIDDIFSISAGMGFDFSFGGAFGIGIYSNFNYYFWGEKTHIGEFEAQDGNNNWTSSYDFKIEEPKIKQYIPSLSLKFFVDID